MARSKDETATVTWVHGDATTVPGLGADLAVMTGNVAQVFLTDDDWAETVQGVHAALHPDGYFVFETRRPERRAWEEWVEPTLVTHGYRVLDVREAPDRPGRELVFIAQRTT